MKYFFICSLLSTSLLKDYRFLTLAALQRSADREALRPFKTGEIQLLWMNKSDDP